MKTSGDQMTTEIFNGDLIAEAGKVYEYTEITGNLKIESMASFPKLKKVGGCLYINANAKLDAQQNEIVGIRAAVSLHEAAMNRMSRP